MWLLLNPFRLWWSQHCRCRGCRLLGGDWWETKRILHAQTLDSIHRRQHCWNSFSLAYNFTGESPDSSSHRKPREWRFWRKTLRLTCRSTEEKKKTENPNLTFNPMFNPKLWLCVGGCISRFPAWPLRQSLCFSNHRVPRWGAFRMKGIDTRPWKDGEEMCVPSKESCSVSSRSNSRAQKIY